MNSEKTLGRSWLHDDLTHFAMEFISRPLDTVLPLNGVINFGQGTTITLFRDAPFQVELVTLIPGAGLPVEHRHPDIDTVDLPFVDFIPLTMGNKPCRAYPRRRPSDVKKILPALILNRIDHDDWHGASYIANGSVLLSVQKWLHGVEPSSVVLNWQGPPASDLHEQLLRRHGAKAA